VANKDRGQAKSKKKAQKSLKEKRVAKKLKGDQQRSSYSITQE